MLKSFLIGTAFATASAGGARAHHAGDGKSKVAVVYDHALPNVPGKSLRACSSNMRRQR
jgi:hypothetical protein